MGYEWRAPDGATYFVEVVDVTGRPAVPEVVACASELKFFREDGTYLGTPVHANSDVADLYDELDRLFLNARDAGVDTEVVTEKDADEPLS